MLKQMMDSMDHDARKLVRVNSRSVGITQQPAPPQLVVAAVAALGYSVAALAGRRGAAAGARRRAAAADADDAGAHARRALRAPCGGQPNPMLLQNVRAAVELTGADGAPAAALREVASVALEGEPAFVDPHLLNLAREGSPAPPPPPAVDADPMAAQAIASYLQARLTPLRRLAARAPRRRARRRRRGRRGRVRRRFVAGAHARARGADAASAAPEARLV